MSLASGNRRRSPLGTLPITVKSRTRGCCTSSGWGTPLPLEVRSSTSLLSAMSSSDSCQGCARVTSSHRITPKLHHHQPDSNSNVPKSVVCWPNGLPLLYSTPRLIHPLASGYETAPALNAGFRRGLSSLGG